ncbi:MAG: hypothetical protein CME71_13000 [Halobacteriovorax sp.]|nr:hypothetical protein [Halobacteriovorax sp.]
MSKIELRTIKVFGGASKKLVSELEVDELSMDLTLMEFLRLKKVPVASSCYGEGVCRKCIVKVEETEVLSCMMTIKHFLNNHEPVVLISYL